MKTIVTVVFTTALIFLASEGFGQSVNYVESKVLKVETAYPNAPAYNAIARGKYMLDSAAFANGRLILRFSNISMIPQLAHKRKDGLQVIYGNEGNNCEELEVQFNETVFRNDIRKQLYAQYESALLQQAHASYKSTLATGLANGRSILELSTEDVYSPATDSSNISSLYKAHKKAFQSQFDLIKKQTGNEILASKLDREEALALSSMTNHKKRFKKYSKTFKKLIKSQKGNPRLYSNLEWSIDLGEVATGQIEIAALTKRGSYAKIVFDTLSGERYSHFAQVDSANCYPINRYLYYKQLPGYDYKSSTYKDRYKPQSEKTRFRNFTLYFEHNKSHYDRRDVLPILDFLADSNFVIQQAKVLAYASVEGDSANNHRLQRERAEVLISLLQQAQSEDSIELVEITTAEHWEMFSEQIKKSRWKDWEKRSHNDVKLLLENDSTAALLQPILSKQRRAVLKLKVIEKLTAKRRKEVMVADYHKAISKHLLGKKASTRQSGFLKAARIRSYVKSAIREGLLQESEYCHIISSGSPNLDIIDFYEMTEDLRNGKSPVCQNIQDILLNAHYSSVLRLNREFKSKKEYTIRLRQAVDIQMFTFESILNGTIPALLFARIDYPRNPKFNYLLVNKFYFQTHDGKSLVAPYVSKPVRTVDEHGRPIKSLYYYILKEMVLADEFQLVKQHIKYFEFELYQFLSRFAVGPWDPESGEFFDDEVDAAVMLKQLERLQGVRTILCRKQLNQLALDYHTKAAYYHYLQEGGMNPKTQNALAAIRKYYNDRLEQLSDSQVMKVVKHLLWYNQKTTKTDLLKEATALADARVKPQPSVGFRDFYYRLKAFDPRRFERRIKQWQSENYSRQWCKLLGGRNNVPINHFMDDEVKSRMCDCNTTQIPRLNGESKKTNR